MPCSGIICCDTSFNNDFSTLQSETNYLTRLLERREVSELKVHYGGKLPTLDSLPKKMSKGWEPRSVGAGGSQGNK